MLRVLNLLIKIFQYQLIRKVYFESPCNTHEYQSKLKEILKPTQICVALNKQYKYRKYKVATTVNTLLVLFLGYPELIKSFDYKKLFTKMSFFKILT